MLCRPWTRTLKCNRPCIIVARESERASELCAGKCVTWHSNARVTPSERREKRSGMFLRFMNNKKNAHHVTVLPAVHFRMVLGHGRGYRTWTRKLNLVSGPHNTDLVRLHISLQISAIETISTWTQFTTLQRYLCLFCVLNSELWFEDVCLIGIVAS
jgi:hypothetical protein